MGLQEVNALLSAISRTQAHFLEKADPGGIFEELLNDVLALTGSEYGFMGELLLDVRGQPYLKSHAITDISWNDATRRFYEQNRGGGLVFSNLDTLFGEVIKTGRVVIANDPAADPRQGGLPPGHPPLRSFLGMPVRSGNDTIGMIGVANRRGGYDAALVDYLQPLLDSYGRIIALMRANQRHEAMRTRLDAIVTTAVDGIVVIDAGGIIRSCNPALERMFGHRADELVGRSINMLMPESYRGRHDAAIGRYLETGKGSIIGIGREAQGQRADGEIFPIHLSVNEFVVEGERFFAGIVGDLSRLKRVEGVSRRFKMMLDQIHDSVFGFDPETLRFTYVNEAAIRQVGYSEAELYTMTPLDLKPLFSEEPFREMIAALRRGEKDALTFSTLHKRRDGARLPVEILLQYLAPADDAPCFIAVARDISERIEAENAVRVSDERLRLSQSFANIGTWDWNIRSGELFWSERIAPLFGYVDGELATTYENFLNAVHPDDRQAVIDAVNACIESGAEYNIEHRCVWPDGSIHWLLERGDVIRDKDGTPLRMLGVVQDISGLKHGEQELLAAKEEAERANRAKSDFLSGMSHELRTPLNAIMGFAQLFNYGLGASDQQRQIAGEIYRAGKHLRTLIDDILDLARIEAGHFQVSLEPVAVARVVEECRNLVTPLALKRGVTLQLELAPCDGLAVLADQTRLKQVILNLLSNAVKYNRQGGVVTLACSPCGDTRLRLSVSDTGMGIQARDMQHLFKPFSRLVDEHSDIEGSGIGLSISKQFVELMQGAIGVESEPGRGSTFWVELALSEAAPASAPERATAHRVELAERCPADARLLVIEDNPTNRAVFKYQLQALGYRPEIVGSPREILPRLREAPYDVILTDIHMPGMDGYELVRYLRELERDSDVYTPVIAVTANALAGERERCLRAGMDDYIPKPVDMEVLKHTLAHWLGQAELRPAPRGAAPVAAPACAVSINRARLAALVGGDIRQQRAIINNFFETLPETLTAIHAAYKQTDAAQLYFWTHRFKSSSAAVGAECLAQMCQTIEDFSHAQDWDHVAALIGELDTQVQRVVKDLKAALADFDRQQCELSAGPERAAHHIGVALVVDDDPVILCALEAALTGIGVPEVLSARSGAEALQRMDEHEDGIDVVLCDLNMPVMDGVEYLRHLVARNYRGALVLLSGEDSRILSSARTLADAHSFQSVAALAKPVAQARLADVLAAITPRQEATARRARSEVSLPELQRAILEDEFVVYYQPKIDASSRRLVGVESLVRWQHPQKNLVMPDQFIPMAEENGLIDELTDLVLEKAFAQLKYWRGQGLDLTVSINIAVGTIGRRIDFPERVMLCLERYGLAPQDVILELTEGGLMKDIATTLDALVRLRLKGVTLSIDDFGTGYSTFRQLQGIPFSELKIDKEFVMNAVADPSSRAILESSVLLGQKLNMMLVAEGVETEADWALLKQLGCHMVQGFFIARPMPGEQLEEWYTQWSAQAD